MNLIEEALRKARKEGKDPAGELTYEINPNNIVNRASPKRPRFLLGIGIVILVFILGLGLVLFFRGPEKLTQTNPKILASHNLAPNAQSNPQKTLAPGPQKERLPVTASQELKSVSEEKVPVIFKNLILEFNGNVQTLKDGEHIKIKRGDLITLKDVAIEGGSPQDVKVNFLGFAGNPSDTTGDDRGYTINTASDLRESYSLDGKGTIYPITIEKEGDQLGTMYVDIETPKTVLVKRQQVPTVNHQALSSKQTITIESLLNKAFVYSQAGNYALALECYDKILAAKPLLFEALLNRGITRTKLEDLEGAEQDLLNAYAINSHDPLLLNALGVLYLKNGDEAKAENFLLKTGDTISTINLALSYWKKGEKEKVILLLKQAEEQNTQDPYPSYYLGLFYRQLGENALAREKLDKALSLAQKRGLFNLIHQIDSIIPGL
ncbi:MAG TPA: tetratricopeptide repeat protein [Thermodesulfobacteriota bacterium]|nr:tetratricopeptide repeat protein [Thermodesulfobacteriota bacterium]